MEISLISFGKIAEFAKPQSLIINGINNTEELKNYLENLFPELKQMKYKLALNQQLVQDHVTIPEHSTIALLPPFSGG